MSQTPGGWDDPERAPQFWTAPIDRRRFLIVLGGAAAYASLAPHESWAKKASRPRPANLQPWTMPSTAPSDPIELTRALIGAAVLAPSNWNSQPWRWEVDQGAVRLVADPTRALPVTDPDRRGQLVSLGAALENFLIAARAYGLRPNVTYFPRDGANDIVAQVTWTAGEARRDRQMFAAIPDRRTNRRNYDERGIFMQNRGQLGAQMPEDLRLHWIDDRDEIRGVGDVVYEATREQVLDPRAQAERASWMRFEEKDAVRRGDGVTIDALELGGPAKWLAGRYFNPRSWFLRYGAGSAAKQAREGVRSAGALALLCSPSRTETARLIGGQAYERFALKATQLGIAHQPMNAPIEVERFRGDLLRRFHAPGEDPLMLVRLGHAKRPDPTPRRAVALVSSFRNS
jgi:nitroreductase